MAGCGAAAGTDAGAGISVGESGIAASIGMAFGAWSGAVEIVSRGASASSGTARLAGVGLGRGAGIGALAFTAGELGVSGATAWGAAAGVANPTGAESRTRCGVTAAPSAATLVSAATDMARLATGGRGLGVLVGVLALLTGLLLGSLAGALSICAEREPWLFKPCEFIFVCARVAAVTGGGAGGAAKVMATPRNRSSAAHHAALQPPHAAYARLGCRCGALRGVSGSSGMTGLCASEVNLLMVSTMPSISASSSPCARISATDLSKDSSYADSS